MPIRQPGSLTKNGSTCPPELPADHHFPNPESEWLREPVADLRILDDDLWTAVQSRQKALSEIPTAHIRKPKRLLSGLVKRGECGGAMTLYGQKLSCNAHRERGTCKNTKVIAIKTVERRVLEGLKEKLLCQPVCTTPTRCTPTCCCFLFRSSTLKRGQQCRKNKSAIG